MTKNNFETQRYLCIVMFSFNEMVPVRMYFRAKELVQKGMKLNVYWNYKKMKLSPIVWINWQLRWNKMKLFKMRFIISYNDIKSDALRIS